MNKILNFIDNHKEANTLFVLKGFNLELFDIQKTILSKTIENKILRLVALSQEDRAIIAYDEFICIFDLAIMQFKKIYIIDNSIFNNIYPINVFLDDNVSSNLLHHFDNDTDDISNESVVMTGITEYTSIYNNYIEINGIYACSYNLNESLLKHDKIQRIIFDNIDIDRSKHISTSSKETIILYSEVDYFSLAIKLYSTSNQFLVIYDGYISSKESINHKILLLISVFPDRIFIKTNDNIASSVNDCPNEILNIMKKYWGYSSFRDISVYDLNSLKNKEKNIVSISQSQIISDLVEQMENCVQHKAFRDIFVTAPTGSGKSVMFQLPAIYIAEKYNLITLVITPLIGLMNDQIDLLKRKGYYYARTINSDISPIIKNEILEDVANGKCHILYLSPESLLSRSDIQQLIGSRKIGMVIVDESHIVTTWGKQFRPDYWYLGDHIQKIRRKQSNAEDNPSSFIIATFTATAIYEGNEDMYHETLNSLHMIDPITYLGYVKRNDIEIDIAQVEEKKNKTEYEINKFDAMMSMINTALMRNQKTLIYFPTVALINRFHDYCYSKDLGQYVTKYHGQLPADLKQESFLQFKDGEKLVMLATKAFGMGIDIPDISIVSHFSPTGNVCDYMQEIGRAARDPKILGQAIYKHMGNDFKHINRLHGLSAIQKYQLIEVIKKVLDIYVSMRYKNSSQAFTKKRNGMLVDIESFGYIFESPIGNDSDNLMNKVKTAMLLIQKDYENRGFAPFYMKPIPLFAYGYFAISPQNQKLLNEKFNDVIKLIYYPQNICEVNLKAIWEKTYKKNMSFPKFKFLLYSKGEDVKLINNYNLTNAMCADLDFVSDENIIFTKMFNCIKDISNKSILQGKYFSEVEIINFFANGVSISTYRSENIINVILASISIYQKEYSNRLNIKLYKANPLRNGSTSYLFNPSIREFFAWISSGYQHIKSTAYNNKIYIENDSAGKRCKEITTLLGILESFGILRFKILGGSNSQIYIYVNETKTMQMVKDRPSSYKNRLLETINNRHTESVKMLKFLFQNNFNSEEIWNHLENYFIGILPLELNEKSVVEIEEDADTILQIQIGEKLKDDYADWNGISMKFENSEVNYFELYSIPLADYYGSKFIYGESVADVSLLWFDKKIAIISKCSDKMYSIIENNDWICINTECFTALNLKKHFEGK